MRCRSGCRLIARDDDGLNLSATQVAPFNNSVGQTVVDQVRPNQLGLVQRGRIALPVSSVRREIDGHFEKLNRVQ